MAAAGSKGRVFLVGAGPGAADLVTVRGWRILQTADVVVHDALIDPAMYADLPAEKIDAGKRAGDHGIGQDAIAALLVERARRGQIVVRLKGGDPFVLGRGFEEVQALQAAGVAWELVPGVSSATGAPTLCGIPLTHRGLSDAFVVVSAHPRDDGSLPALPPFHPRLTVVVLMGVKTAPLWVAALLERAWPDSTPVAFAVAASWPDAELRRTTLAGCELDAAAWPLRTPAVAVVGDVVDLQGQSP
jgi:uroporphyrin-III C-methyltransferase